MEIMPVEWATDRGTRYLLHLRCINVKCADYGERWTSLAVTQYGVQSIQQPECDICGENGEVDD